MSTPIEIWGTLKAKVLAAITIVAGAATLVHGLREQLAVQVAQNLEIKQKLDDAVARLSESGIVETSELLGVLEEFDKANQAFTDLHDQLALDANDLAKAVATIPEPAPIPEPVPEPEQKT